MASPHVALVTGCTAGGLGHAVALRLARSGCTVFATARRLDAMAGLAEAGCCLLTLDVTCPSAVAAAVEQVLARAGALDLVVNSAGVSGRGPVAEYDLAEARRQFEVNVLGSLAVVQAVVPSMLAQRSGRIIQIGSALGLLTVPFAGLYCASKKALQALTDALRMELAGSGVEVVYAAPGWVRTNILDTMAASGANRLHENGPWAPCRRFVTGNLYEVEARHACTAEKFAESFCRMALSPHRPPRVWLNSVRDGWLAAAASRLAPAWLLDASLQLRYGLGRHLFARPPARQQRQEEREEPCLQLQPLLAHKRQRLPAAATCK